MNYTQRVYISDGEKYVKRHRETKKKTEVCSGNQAKGHTEQYANTT